MRGFEFYGDWEGKGAMMPEYKTKEAVCADIYAAEEVTIEPVTVCGEAGIVHTGIHAVFEPNETFILAARSGTFKRKLLLANGIGIFDSDYPGEIIFTFYNMGLEPITIRKGERIGQGMFLDGVLYPDGHVKPDIVRCGGFGSTGIN